MECMTAEEEVPEFSDCSQESSQENTVMVEDEKKEERMDAQPKLLTGGTMRAYQIEGMEWLIGLYENGTNGILG